MKTEILRKVLAGLTVTTIFGILVACGKNAEEVASEATEAVSEAAETAGEVAETAGEEMMSLEEQIQAVQDTLVFMGGLKTGDDAAKDIEIAMFRNDQGDIIYVYVEDGHLDYGMWTTEDATTADGKPYSKLTGGEKEYGYYFNEDLVTGIIVDADGTVYDAVELDEKVARDFVSQTLGG
jgi:lipopolysaccharide export LptBFGC system permease protein LptF